ncbi:MAG: 2-hydroxyacyl-CoA dehydratase family protein [Promethearchaeota archaeon]|jgi:benzoyl-CoA reductase/2-hydroxyglutaryl-CoA dehydratase subunit BcrC/BadD/HgdB
MSLVADELIRFSSVLRIAYNFLTGRDYLKRKKFREKKKLISVGLPFSDIVYAFPDLIPVFPIRMHEFKIHRYLTYLGSASNIFGWNRVSDFLGFVKDLGIKDVSQTVDNIIENVIETINEKYNEMYDFGEESGIPTDFCYGVKSLYGMNVSKGKNCEANLNYTIRCSAWNKYLESIKAIGNPSKQIWIEIPPRNIGNSIELFKDNIVKGLNELEKISDYTYSDNALRNHFQTANQIHQAYRNIIYEISPSDFYPCNPATFSEILALLNISFHDYNSNASRFRDNISSLLDEMKGRIQKGIGMDVSKMPKILITPMFGGWEPKTHDIIYELGGRVMYGDWDLLKFLDDIPISNNADPIEAYAQYLMNVNSNGIGCDNNTLTDSYIRLAENLKADGLLFIQVFGCHSISNCYTMLKEKLRRNLGIPSIALNFNKMGENVEQVKTRLGAFMEMFNHQ